MKVASTRRAAQLFLAITFAVVGCSSSPAPPTSEPSAVEFPLTEFTPTVLPGHTAACAPEPVNAILRASVTDPSKVWAVDATSGARFEVVWPADYRVRFDPNATILDADGNAVLHEGDPVTRSCHTGNVAVLWIDPLALAASAAP